VAARVVALVPAAGSGSRFGGALPKQFLQIGGRPLLAWTLERLLACGVDELTVALPAAEVERAREMGLDDRVRVIAGGASRQDSVARALAASPGGEHDLVLVHDGARPAVAPADVARTVAAAASADGAVLGRSLGDTLKRVAGGVIASTVPREGLFRAETPQVFRRGVLARALDAARRDGFEGTDESALVERLGDMRVLAVEATARNPKLTTPADLELVRALLLGGQG